jgi:hypothetical protein
MATITIPGMFLTGTHAARPAATAVGTGSLYSCSTHSLIYQSNGATWSTWATLAGTGAPGEVTIARLSARRTNATTSFADVTDLGWSILANTNYVFHFYLQFWTNATTTGIRFAINGPASPTALRFGGSHPTASPGSDAVNHASGIVTAYDTPIRATASGPGFADSFAHLHGIIRNGANAGTLQLRFASEVAVADAAVVEVESYGELIQF